jgi:hypothetical protein
MSVIRGGTPKLNSPTYQAGKIYSTTIIRFDESVKKSKKRSCNTRTARSLACLVSTDYRSAF